ncbi:periplasmic heavy metal sensor [Candidatus Poribacteria bacterium]|nr:periplasmic heavy metal sensor [Candidatus Poribacteria bacterium]
MKPLTTTLIAVAAAATLTAGVAVAKGPAAGAGKQDTPAAEQERGPGGFRGGRHGRHGGPEMGPPREELEALIRFWDDPDLVEAISLTGDQIKLLEDSYTETKAALEESKGTLREAHDALREAVEADTPDIKTVNKAVDAVTEAQNQKMKELLGHRVVVKTVLTTEQEEGVESFRRDHVRGIVASAREEIRDLREQVRELASDGELSDADWDQINGTLDSMEPRLRDRVQNRLREFREGGPEAGPPPGLEDEAGPRPRHERRQDGTGYEGRRGRRGPHEPLPPLPPEDAED